MEDIQKNGDVSFYEKLISGLFAKKERDQKLIDLLISRAAGYGNGAWYYGVQAMRDRKDHVSTLQQLKAPVQILAGEKDGAVPVDLAYKMAGIGERVRLVVYPGVGHMGMYECTHAMITDLATFVEG